MTLKFDPRLTDAHCDQCDTILQDTPAALEYCARCERAGLDMSAHRQTLEAQQKIAAGIKKEFFPLRI